MLKKIGKKHNITLMPQEQIKTIHRLGSISFRMVLILSKPFAGERGDGTVQDFCKVRINI